MRIAISPRVEIVSRPVFLAGDLVIARIDVKNDGTYPGKTEAAIVGMRARELACGKDRMGAYLLPKD
ncbi:nitrogen fixation protein NifZ [Rhizobium grahamii]|uniref:NifZ family protein n=1 Tax=Rhizobium grahamii CCGE 502 TaxID=990285 RepID=S3H3H2_9HYPH|nr:nitrogen fixation protein NifZ [Rhizobium grahamii]EPE93722.1 NifZ family protein [Rhizobium grahamii CCGE 502]